MAVAAPLEILLRAFFPWYFARLSASIESSKALGNWLIVAMFCFSWCLTYGDVDH
jgi:hypothetical protein